MQTYDLVMLALMAAAVLFGAWKGLAWQVASLSAIFVSYIVALQFRAPIANMIQVQPPLNQFIAMFAIYAATSLAIWVGFGYVKSFIDRFYLKSFDRQAGALVGALKGALLCIVVTLFAVTLLGDARRTQICQSKSGLLIARTINQLRGIMPKEIHPILAPYLNKFDDVMTQNNAEYAKQPSLPNFGGQQGSDFGANVQQFAGQIFFGNNQQNSGQEYPGSFQGITWPQSSGDQLMDPNRPATQTRNQQFNLGGAVQNIFEQVTHR
jgi:membrane protein required for colicin V production